MKTTTKSHGKNKTLIILCLFFCIALIGINAAVELNMRSKNQQAGSVSDSNKEQQKSDSRILTAINSESAYAVYIGDTIMPALELVPHTAVTQLSYESSAPEVAQIDSNGVITGVSEGKTTIKVNGTSNVSISYEIVVKKKMPDPAKDYPELFDEKLQVINAWNPLSSDYEPEVVKAKDKVRVKAADISLTAEALDSYVLMYEACKEATGEKILLITAYRSYSTQKYIHNNSIKSYMDKGYSKEKATELASKTVQPPGNSEHQLGLAIDIGTTQHVSDTFHQTKVGAWVTEHAHEYGWILRYPADKTKATGISYEPWHFRYVGVEHAKYIQSHNLCLEEYDKLQDEAAQNALEYSASHPATCD